MVLVHVSDCGRLLGNVWPVAGRPLVGKECGECRKSIQVVEREG
jgi:hypothetical protein